MIQAAQFRIGNLVEYRITDKFDDRKEWWEVSEIDADDIHWLSKVDTEDEDFRPIPLTEEWLLKFGFVKKLSNYELENFRFHVNKPSNYDGFLFCEGYSVITDKIHFVHQLQNLYFALNNKELNYETRTI